MSKIRIELNSNEITYEKMKAFIEAAKSINPDSNGFIFSEMKECGVLFIESSCDVTGEEEDL